MSILDKITESGADAVQNTEFRAFGFITAQLRRGFIITSFALCVFAIIYLMYANNSLNKQLIQNKETQREQEQILYDRILTYFEPKLKLLDSTATVTKNNVIKQDSLQVHILNKINK